MIELERVTKVLGAVRALDDVSFRIEPGAIAGFLGPNGAGKTTAMRLLAGVLPPTTGTVRVAGHEQPAERAAARGAIGYLPEGAPLHPELTVVETLESVARLRGLDRSARRSAVALGLARAELADVAGRLVGRLSRGMRQRLGLAHAMLGEPEVLLLDEPTEGLDPERRLAVRERIEALGGERTVLFSSHALVEVQALADVVVVLDRGRVLAVASPEELAERLGATDLDAAFVALLAETRTA